MAPREITIKRADAGSALLALDAAFPGRDWSGLMNGRPVILMGKQARTRARVVLALAKAFDPDQPRDEQGRWSEIAGAAGRLPPGSLTHSTVVANPKLLGQKFEGESYEPLSPTEQETARRALDSLPRATPDRAWFDTNDEIDTRTLGFTHSMVSPIKDKLQIGVNRVIGVGTVPLNRITATQSSVAAEGLRNYVGNVKTDLPVLAEYPGGHFSVVAGHTRIGVQALAGRKSVKALIVPYVAPGGPKALRTMLHKPNYVEGPAVLAKAFDEAEHPRAPAGSSTGGQFVAGAGGGIEPLEGTKPPPGGPRTTAQWAELMGLPAPRVHPEDISLMSADIPSPIRQAIEQSKRVQIGTESRSSAIGVSRITMKDGTVKWVTSATGPGLIPRTYSVPDLYLNNLDHIDVGVSHYTGLGHDDVLKESFVPYGRVSDEQTKLWFPPRSETLSDYVKQSGQFTYDQQSAIEDYADGSYKGINRYLTDNTLEQNQNDTAYRERQIMRLDEALDKSHLIEATYLWRGGKTKQLPPNLNVGDSFINHAFSSTSLSRGVAKDFSKGVMFKIEVDKGTHALVGHHGEHEVVLPRNGRFTVTSLGFVADYDHTPLYTLKFEDTGDKTIYREDKKPRRTRPEIWDLAVAKAGIRHYRYIWEPHELDQMLANAQMAKMWDEGQHPRAPAGRSDGGRFVSGGSAPGAATDHSSTTGAGRDRTGVTASGAYHISDRDKTRIRQLIARGETADRVAHDPTLVAARAYAESLPVTKNAPGYDTPAWRVHREFNGGLIGYNPAVDKLTNHALSYSKHGPVQQNYEATILLGPPAAGKSGFAERIAADHHAAIIDPDDAKPLFKEFRGGIGANAVHDESSLLISQVARRLGLRGVNMIFPKVGASRDSIDDLTKTLKAMGYRVNLGLMKVNSDEAYKRAVGRFLDNNRLISHSYTKLVNGNPQRTYDALKGNGNYEQTFAIDNNGPPGVYHVYEGAETPIGRTLTRPRR